MKIDWRKILSWKEISERYDYIVEEIITDARVHSPELREPKPKKDYAYTLITACNILQRSKSWNEVMFNPPLEAIHTIKRRYISNSEPVMELDVIIYKNGWNWDVLNNQELEILNESKFRNL